MSAFSLSLDKIQIKSAVEKLNLSVATSVSFVCSDSNIKSLDFSQLSKLLSSGKVWVSRGNGCRLNFTVRLDGRPLEQLDRERVIEDFGQYVRNARVSSTLSYLKFNPLRVHSSGPRFHWTPNSSY